MELKKHPVHCIGCIICWTCKKIVLPEKGALNLNSDQSIECAQNGWREQTEQLIDVIVESCFPTCHEHAILLWHEIGEQLDVN